MSFFSKSIVFLIVFASFSLSFLMYDALPDRIITHWNSSGVADGFMSKPLGVFLTPAIASLVLFLLVWLFNVSPNREVLASVATRIDFFVVVLALFFLYLHSVMIAFNVGYVFSIVSAFIPAFGILFFVIGFVSYSIPRNYIFGVRTPWTLASDLVWKKTHRLAGLLFQATGLISFAGLFFSTSAFLFLFIPLVLAAFISILYSYILYKKGS